ncbi:MAG: sugar phosphate isomerase/epimerase [Cyclobacteriaceae bacterium]|nr:sugar phosphate isomerase/epimerase [Cyclobacteriaceae bacterium]
MCNRRNFLQQSTIALAGAGLFGGMTMSCFSGKKEKTAEEDVFYNSDDMFFKISLAQWSLFRQFYAGEITNLEFPGITKTVFGLEAVEYVNQFFADKAKDMDYLKELKMRSGDLGIKNVLIMIDDEGYLAVADEKERIKAVENHYKWVEAAKYLGCHAIRVNAYTTDEDPEDARLAAIDGLSRLCEFAKPYDINILVENHGGFSSNGQWLASVMRGIDLDNRGTLPDFGNFCIKRTEPEENTIEAWMNTVCLEEYDKYKGMKELMPFAFGVSAKSHNFDEEGNEKDIDYYRMMRIVKDAGYTGYVGIEYEGPGDAYEGIKDTRNLLIKVGQELT